MVDYAEIRELSIDEAKAEILAVWEALQIKEPLYWGPGSLPSMLLECTAWMTNKLSRMNVASKVLTLGEAATGTALTLWSKSVYNHVRYPSTTARHQVRLTCAAGSGPYVFDVGSCVVASDATTFRLVAPVSPDTLPYSLPSGGTRSFVFECEEPGTIGNATLSDINRLVTSHIGVTCENINIGGGSSLVVSGTDEESDDALHARNRVWWAALNPMSPVRDAIEYYARMASAEVRRVQVIDDNPRGQFTFDVVVGGGASAISSTGLAAVTAKIRERFLSTFADLMEVYGATARQIDLVGPVYYYSAFNDWDVKAAIRNALQKLAEDLPIGGETFVAHGNNRVLRAQFEKAIEGATVGEQKCIRVAPLRGMPESIQLSPYEQVVFSSNLFGSGLIELIPVDK